MRAAPILLGLLALAGCTTIRRSTTMFPNGSHDWRQVATEDDQKRLRDWRTDFTAALDAARRAGHGAEIDREGALLQPDAAQTGSVLAAGLYRCRVLKVGAKAPGDLPYAASGPLTCRVSQQGSIQRFAVVGGVQRELGRIFPADAVRQVFLGTLILPGESRAMQYGADENRDIAGYVERIGPQRWRLVMPAPHFDALLEVVELVP
jgi:hypothetical protein